MKHFHRPTILTAFKSGCLLMAASSLVILSATLISHPLVTGIVIIAIGAAIVSHSLTHAGLDAVLVELSNNTPIERYLIIGAGTVLAAILFIALITFLIIMFPAWNIHLIRLFVLAGCLSYLPTFILVAKKILT